MFRYIFIFALFATCCGYCWADGLPAEMSQDPVQCASAENGFDCGGAATGGMSADMQQPQYYEPAPVWPAPGSDADMQVATSAMDSGVRYAGDENDNIRIVSKIGADLVVENNINMGARGNEGMGFSGGANLTHGYQAPMGFNVYEGQAEMPLMHQEMLEDDGASVLAMSRSGRKKVKEPRAVGAGVVNNINNGGPDFAVEEECEDECQDDFDAKVQDQVRSWVVASGQTLREVLQDWCNKEGWDLVWGTSREYPIQASAVFKGRFLDVSSALVRNFSRANPVPYAKFYKGNRVVVISTAVGD